MQRDSLKKRLEVLEAGQPLEEEEEGYIEVSEEAEETYKKWYLACQKATETEEKFNKLFIGCACDALALVNMEKTEDQKRKDQERPHEIIDLEVMEKMVKLLKEKGIEVEL